MSDRRGSSLDPMTTPVPETHGAGGALEAPDAAVGTNVAGRATAAPAVLSVRGRVAAQMLWISRSEFDRRVRPRLRYLLLHPGVDPLYRVADLLALIDTRMVQEIEKPAGAWEDWSAGSSARRRCASGATLHLQHTAPTKGGQPMSGIPSLAELRPDVPPPDHPAREFPPLVARGHQLLRMLIEAHHAQRSGNHHRCIEACDLCVAQIERLMADVTETKERES